MQKIRIVSLEADKGRVVAALHVMGALDLRKSKLELGDDRPPVYSTDVSDSLIKVNGAVSLLSIQKVKPEKQISVKQLVLEVKSMKVLNEVYDLGSERKLIEDDQKAIDYAEHIAQAFSHIKIDFGRLRSNYLTFRAFETDGKGAKQFERLVKKAEDKNVDLEISRSGKKEFLILATYPKSASIEDYVKAIRLNELDLTAKYLDNVPHEILKNVKKRREDNNRRLGAIQKRLEQISHLHYSRLSNIKEMLEIELQRSDATASFKRTDQTFILEGWVQKRQVDEVIQRVSNVTKGKAYVEPIDAEDELAPTFTRRPKWLQPFDYMVSFYSVQRSDEIDPTWIFILSFPIFYGLMVSDVGYGVASLILATWIAKKTNPDGLMYNASKLWQINAIAAIFFGVLSNQYFGLRLYSLPFGFDWLKNTPQIIAITILFGVAQVILGLVIGIINSWNHEHKKLAYARFTSILFVVFGTIAVAGFFFSVFNAQISEIAAVIGVISFILTILWSGEEATEVVNLITHPLSYARLMGFGLASVIIALLINMSFTPNLNQGIIVFVIYAVIFIALHFLNMSLSIFEGLVQGVRLNFVEFFSKFYMGNGVLFKPFSYKRIYTKE